MGKLHRACKKVHLSRVRELLEEDIAYINELNEDGHSPLYYLLATPIFFKEPNLKEELAFLHALETLHYLTEKGARLTHDETIDFLTTLVFEKPSFLRHHFLLHLDDFNLNGFNENDIEYFFVIDFINDFLPLPKHQLSQSAIAYMLSWFNSKIEFYDHPRIYACLVKITNNATTDEIENACLALAKLIRQKLSAASFPDVNKLFYLADDMHRYLKNRTLFSEESEGDYWVCLETVLLAKSKYYMVKHEYAQAHEMFVKLLHLNVKRLRYINHAYNENHTLVDMPSPTFGMAYADIIPGFLGEINFLQWQWIFDKNTLEMNFFEVFGQSFNADGDISADYLVSNFYKLYFNVVKQSTEQHTLQLAKMLRDFMYLINYLCKWQQTPSIVAFHDPATWREYLANPETSASFTRHLVELDTHIKKQKMLARVMPTLFTELHQCHMKINVLNETVALLNNRVEVSDKASNKHSTQGFFAHTPITLTENAKKRPLNEADNAEEDQPWKRQRTLEAYGFKRTK